VSTIVIFDGVCNLCNGAVDFLLSNDRTDSLFFASFQGGQGARVLREHGVFEAPNTVYVIHHGKLFTESRAILLLSQFMRPWWLRTSGRLCTVVPKRLADVIYRFVARNRYRWFGKRESCRIPTPLEAARFLD
jgi:predicted DCC family thiol-disulfide oxidoreductase YuxK